MSDEQAKPTGRPSLFDRELCERVIDRVAEGVPLAQVLREERAGNPEKGIPANPKCPKLRTFYDWLDNDEELSASIARARLAGEDELASQCLEIADTPVLGVEQELVRKPRDAQGGEVEDPDGFSDLAPAEYDFVVAKEKRSDMLGHRKLQIETRLKLLAKFNPRRWGERLDLAGVANAPLVTRLEVIGVAATRNATGDGDGST